MRNYLVAALRMRGNFGQNAAPGSLNYEIANLAHLLRIEVLDLLLILEKLLNAPHLLYHPTELLELVEQGMHLEIMSAFFGR